MSATTWANGYGTWHARVTDGPNAERQARAAIRSELRERGDIGPGIRVRVERVTSELRPSSVAGTAVYREVWPH